MLHKSLWVVCWLADWFHSSMSRKLWNKQYHGVDNLVMVVYFKSSQYIGTTLHSDFIASNVCERSHEYLTVVVIQNPENHVLISAYNVISAKWLSREDIHYQLLIVYCSCTRERNRTLCCPMR